MNDICKDIGSMGVLFHGVTLMFFVFVVFSRANQTLLY